MVTFQIRFDVRLITTPHYVFRRFWTAAVNYCLSIAGLHARLQVFPVQVRESFEYTRSHTVVMSVKFLKFK